MVDIRDAIVDYINRNGPSLPAQISKNFKIDQLFSGALLSELVAKNKLKITSVKKGSSPYYYLQGQEASIDNLAENLSGKPKEAYQLIKSKKLVRDITAEPWQRVALREIRDYAHPLQIDLGDRQEIFWKWYLTPNSEVSGFLKNLLEQDDIITTQKDEPVKQEIQENKEEQAVLVEPRKEIVETKEEAQEIESSEDIFGKIELFFNKNHIYVISKENVRKEKELNYIIDLPSNIGKLRYFVKFKNKKSIADNELISASKEADSKNLPLIFLTQGNLTKKAEKYLHKNQSGKIIFYQLN